MKWITREKVKVDRVACPWLIKKFIDPQAEFVFLPADTDWASLKEGIVYDVPGCELGHHGEDVSFDSILKKYELADPALTLLAQIVRQPTHSPPIPIPPAKGFAGLRSATALLASATTKCWRESSVCTTHSMRNAADVPHR